VLDLTTDVAGAYCALQFAKCGADVDRIDGDEPPSGWAVYLDAYLHAGKNRTRGGRDLAGLQAAAGAYDAVIGDPDLPWADLAGHLRDGAVTATVDPFGETGPYRDWRGTELVFASAGGATGYTRAPDGEPVFGFGHRYEMLAGLYLFTAACAALGGEPGPGEPRVPAIRVSAMETVASVLPYLTTQYVYNGSLSTVEQSGPRYTGACRDGYVVIYAGGPWTDIVAMFERPELDGDARFATPGARFRNEAELGRMFADWCGARTVAEVVAAADRANVAICPAVGLADVLGDEQLALRDGWEPVEVPGVGTGRAPREPYVVNRWRTAGIAAKENA
jgi:crotonobetainyl-CoA:carnitine CoA-transferase CaiB-like acyl-CoA transferase